MNTLKEEFCNTGELGMWFRSSQPILIIKIAKLRDLLSGREKKWVCGWILEKIEYVTYRAHQSSQQNQNYSWNYLGMTSAGAS